MLHDLEKVLDNKQVEINEFFRVSQTSSSNSNTFQKARGMLEFCNIEIPITNPEVPVFSDRQSEYERVTHDLE